MFEEIENEKEAKVEDWTLALSLPNAASHVRSLSVERGAVFVCLGGMTGCWDWTQGWRLVTWSREDAACGGDRTLGTRHNWTHRGCISTLTLLMREAQ